MIGRRALCLGIGAGAGLILAGRSPLAAARGNEVLVGLQNNVFANLFYGKPAGIILEAVDIVLRKSGRTPVYLEMPNSEVAAAMQEGTVGVETVMVETSSNRVWALLTDPIVTEYNVIAVPIRSGLTVNRLADLHGLRLGGRQGYQYPLLDTDPDIKLERFSQDGALIRNLILGRIDAAIIGAVSDVYKLRAEGVMPRIRILNRSVGTVPLRAGLSRRLFTSADLGNFNGHLADLKADPQWTDILERNGFADLVVEWPSITQ